MANELGKPVIGLSVGLLDFGNYAGVGHQRPVALAGGIPLTLPWLNGERLGEALDACDGIGSPWPFSPSSPRRSRRATCPSSPGG